MVKKPVKKRPTASKQPPAAPARKVMFGVPALDGRNSVHFTFAYGETIRLAERLGIPMIFGCRAYDAQLPRARNDLLLDMVTADCTDLILADTDEEWRPEWVFQLLNYPVDVVGAPVVNKSENETYNVRSNVVPIPRDEKTGLLKPSGGCGTGFLRLSRRAVDAVRDISKPYRDATRVENRWVFETAIVDGELVTEDYMLMNKLKTAGFTLYLDPTITCAHIGPKKYTGDFAAWLARVEAAAVQTAVAEKHNALGT